ncbi:unnamed protein product [Heligmosomoides polygyrus]|uniref:Band_7_C domain-containing protein n=1 Tax=Heligmosomoides polygyrus TaxID=6339 RepID=A0A183GSQ0_HELPZ|nr:unnamed protein product [Heligmosomoides polygyrus]
MGVEPRQKTIDAFNVVKDVAVTAAANVKFLFGTVPQMSELCASMGDHKKADDSIIPSPSHLANSEYIKAVAVEFPQ